MLAGNSSIQHQKVVSGLPFFCAYGNDYAYPAEGLMPSHAVTYNVFNQPSQITDVSATLNKQRLELDYGADQQRNQAVRYI